MNVLRESIRASKTAKAQRGFYIHLTAYLMVNLFLIGVNLATTPDRLWFYWVLLGWGLGIGAHGAATCFLSRHRTH
jgi:uncharacterized membrane protein